MSTLQEILIIGQYFLLILPSIVVVAGAWTYGWRAQADNTRQKLLLLLVTAVSSLAFLSLLIWFNPYGREINSSLPAFGMLPVLVALLDLILSKPKEIARLWSTDRAVLTALSMAFLILSISLWLADPTTFYIVVVLTVALALAWNLGSRAGLPVLAVLCLVSLGAMILIGGGSFFILGPGDAAWLHTAQVIVMLLGILMSIFLSAALLYTNLRGVEPVDWRRFAWSLVLIALLLGISVYQVFWDGVWSSAHARAFEDHLPFNYFLLSLMAGVALALSLKGIRRLAGPAFVVLVTSVTTLALMWGWRVSAFELTERRAARLDQALAEYYRDSGRYPASLEELTPRYLVHLPPPVVVRQGGWCYQGSDSGYRLGYVSGDFTYSYANFKTETYAQVGEPPQGDWICSQLVKQFRSEEINY